MVLLATSVIFGWAPPGRAAAALPPQLGEAFRLYLGGKGHAARRLLEATIAEPSAQADPGLRLILLRQLLDICLRNGDSDCVARHSPEFAIVAEQQLATTNAAGRARLAQEASYYIDEARAAGGVDPRAILAGPTWKHEIAFEGELYLRRQVLASNLYLQAGDQQGLDRSLNKILSLTGALQNPQAGRLTLPAALADVIATLLANGQTERAWGLYKTSGADIGKATLVTTLEGASFYMTVAKLHQAVGDPAGARKAWAAAIQILGAIELHQEQRARLLSEAAAAKAVLDAVAGDLPAARATLALHPAAATFYVVGGRTPMSTEELGYLAVRAFVAAAGGGAEPIAAEALAKPIAFKTDLESAEWAAAVRAAGLAMATPAGPERNARLQELGRRMRTVALRDDAAGRLDRIDTVSNLLVAMALGQADGGAAREDAEAAFALVQLMGRTGTSFDADALAALSQAKDELQRRTVQQALRLRARRDRLERERIQKVTAAMSGPPGAGLLQHDYAERRLLRDYDERLADAEGRLAKDGLSIRGPRLVSLARFQAALAPGEAALAVAPTFGGLAYVCVRRDAVFRTVRALDGRQTAIDGKVVQAALTAGHAPSEALDAQFPAEASVRLYDALIRPFEACLKPGDRLLWLGAVAALPAPLSVLLPAKPPKLGAGYDLAAADWLVKRHAVSYAGSAAAVVASRASAPVGTDFDFLGVGDPVLDGRPIAGVRGGGRFSGLAPLPETRRELEASARGFATAEVLTAEGATERRVRGRMLGAYRYISFATHGLLRDDLQGLSEPALVLTPGSSGDARDDGLLTASEIADMRLQAAFVALSACNTANFEFGEMARDLPALASAFAVSGVPATLGTLWPVESQTGETVVSGLFAHLRERGVSPAEALAEAQRAFLAAPPGRAQLHPRFWAPFVVLGDGTRPALAAAPGSVALRAVELAPKGVEVVGLAATTNGVAAWFIAEPSSAGGGIGAGLRLAGSAEAWRAIDNDAAPSRLLAELDGGALVAGGYARLADGRLAPRLQAYDAAGRLTKSWQGGDLSTLDAGFMAAAQESASSLLAVVGERKRAGDPPTPAVRLHVLRITRDLTPALLFEATAPLGADVTSATVTPLGDHILVTYTATNRRADAPPPGLETYDAMACALNQATWIELRDASGRVLKSQTLADVSIAAATAERDGGATVAGYRREGCEGERQALVMAVSGDLASRTLYQDTSLGASEVRALASLPGGRTLVAAHKESVTDYASPGASRPLFFGVNYATLLVTLDRDGRPSAPKLLDAGANVLPTVALARPNGEVLIGGAIGDQAAIFHLAAP